MITLTKDIAAQLAALKQIAIDAKAAGKLPTAGGDGSTVFVRSCSVNGVPLGNGADTPKLSAAVQKNLTNNPPFVQRKGKK